MYRFLITDPSRMLRCAGNHLTGKGTKVTEFSKQVGWTRRSGTDTRRSVPNIVQRLRVLVWSAPLIHLASISVVWVSETLNALGLTLDPLNVAPEPYSVTASVKPVKKRPVIVQDYRDTFKTDQKRT